MVSRYEKKFGIIDVPEDSIYLYKNGFGKVSVLSSGKHLVAGEIAKYNMEYYQCGTFCTVADVV